MTDNTCTEEQHRSTEDPTWPKIVLPVEEHDGFAEGRLLSFCLLLVYAYSAYLQRHHLLTPVWVAFHAAAVTVAWHEVAVLADYWFDYSWIDPYVWVTGPLGRFLQRRRRSAWLKQVRAAAAGVLSISSAKLRVAKTAWFNPVDHLAELFPNRVRTGPVWELAAGALDFVSGDRIAEEFDYQHLLDAYDRALYLVLNTDWEPYPGWRSESA